MEKSFQHDSIQLLRGLTYAIVLAQAAMFLGSAPLASAGAPDEVTRFVFERGNPTIVLEPFGPNIVRVTLSSQKPAALAAPGYGIVGTPSMAGWTREQDSAGYDVVRSGRMLVRVAPKNLPSPKAMPLDELNQSLRNRYFYGDWGRGTYDDSIFISTTAGKPLLTMWRWSMVPNASEATGNNAANQQSPDVGYRVSATFDSPTGEHYYGLGQQQQGFLDLRDHQVKCWHDYSAIGGENVCVPFLVSRHCSWIFRMTRTSPIFGTSACSDRRSSWRL